MPDADGEHVLARRFSEPSRHLSGAAQPVKRAKVAHISEPAEPELIGGPAVDPDEMPEFAPEMIAADDADAERAFRGGGQGASRTWTWSLTWATSTTSRSPRSSPISCVTKSPWRISASNGWPRTRFPG